MKKLLKNTLAIGTLLLLVAPLSAALAREGGSRGEDSESGREESSHVENESDDQDDSDDSIDEEDEDSDIEDDDDSSEQELEDQDSDDDGINDHTEGLLHAAGLDDDISDDIKTLAQEQQVSADIVSRTVTETQDQSKLKKILVGEDLKKLNVIKTEIRNTDQRIEKIQSLADQAKSLEVKQALETEAQALEIDKSDLNDFVQERENKFSFFGWLVRLFSKN